jgi:hypothetical protein
MAHIVLEDTLADFFSVEANRNGTKLPQKIFIAYNPISEVDQAAQLPRSTKYCIQQWRVFGAGDFSPITNLILMPQRMAWIMGNIPVIFFKDETNSFSSTEKDLALTISAIDPYSRFLPRFCTSLKQVQITVGNSLIIPFLPFDGLDHLPHYTDPETHYSLLSKRTLALSGLPTPPTKILDFSKPEMGWNDATLNKAVMQAITAIRTYPIPFVLKSNSSGGSKGVYFVRTVSDQVDLETNLRPTLVTELLRLDTDNSHLHPCSLIISDLLQSNALSINFYVRGDGQGQFSSCCEQYFSESGHWLGGIVKYSAQPKFAVSYRDIIQKTAEFLHSHGYHGPAGIDVMTDDTGRHLVVDLNPRPTGSFILGCLRAHFVDKLNMNEACVLPFMEFSDTRSNFTVAFKNELENCQIIVLAWWSNPEALQSYTCLAIGGRDKISMKKLSKRIEEWVKERQTHIDTES